MQAECEKCKRYGDGDVYEFTFERVKDSRTWVSENWGTSIQHTTATVFEILGRIGTFICRKCKMKHLFLTLGLWPTLLFGFLCFPLFCFDGTGRQGFLMFSGIPALGIGPKALFGPGVEMLGVFLIMSLIMIAGLEGTPR